jgi:hypothetical protein
MGITAEVQDVVPVLPAGVYPATFGNIEEQSNDQGTYWLWTFIAQKGDEVVEVTATSSPRITPRTKAAKFLAGLGVNVAVGQSVNFDELLGSVCQLVISINDAGYSRIDTVLPYVVADTKRK